jgi:hypothetical protein
VDQPSNYSKAPRHQSTKQANILSTNQAKIIKNDQTAQKINAKTSFSNRLRLGSFGRPDVQGSQRAAGAQRPWPEQPEINGCRSNPWVVSLPTSPTSHRSSDLSFGLDLNSVKPWGVAEL